jgi:Sec-independent protein translocase protein TatA
MEIFNIGPMEIVWVVVLMYILLGPREMIRLTRRAGDAIRRASQSRYWKEIQASIREMRDLPTRLAREAGFDEIDAEIRRQNRVHLEMMESGQPASAQQKPGEVRSSGPAESTEPAEPRTHRE